MGVGLLDLLAPEQLESYLASPKGIGNTECDSFKWKVATDYLRELDDFDLAGFARLGIPCNNHHVSGSTSH